MNDSWLAWVNKCGSKLINPGQMLGRSFNITIDETEPVNSQIVGFSILEANSLKEAEELLQGNPHLRKDKNNSFILYESKF